MQENRRSFLGRVAGLLTVPLLGTVAAASRLPGQLYTIENVCGRGLVAESIKDSNGVEWCMRVVSCHSGTGMIERYKVDEAGDYVINRERTELVRETIFVPAPLTVKLRKRGA